MVWGWRVDLPEPALCMCVVVPPTLGAKRTRSFQPNPETRREKPSFSFSFPLGQVWPYDDVRGVDGWVVKKTPTAGYSNRRLSCLLLKFCFPPSPVRTYDAPTAGRATAGGKRTGHVPAP